MSHRLPEGWNMITHSVAISLECIDEWPLARVIDAAIDEQRRRWGEAPLPPRSDEGLGHPLPMDEDRWPWVNRDMAGFRGLDAGPHLCDALLIRDPDLREAVINVHRATFKSR
jgi:hypothetical protein